MHEDSPQVTLSPLRLSQEKAAARLREAEAIPTETGFAGARPEDQAPNLLTSVVSADLICLRDGGLEKALVAPLEALSYTHVAVDITPGDNGTNRRSGLSGDASG